MKKKILILSGNGKPSVSAANIYSERLADSFDITVVEEYIPTSKILSFLKKKLKKSGPLFVIDFTLLRLFRMLFVNYKDVSKNYKPYLITENINSKQVQRLLRDGDYDYVISNACSILTANTIKCAKTKIINLHNGINPRYRGTGNFWAFHEGNFNLIGVTVHYIDEGVDTGEVISIVPDDGYILGNSFADIDIHAFEMGAKEIVAIVKGEPPVGIAEEYKTLESKCYSYPGLSHYFKAKNNFEKHKSEIMKKEDIWHKSFVEKATNKQGDTLEQQHWSDKDIVSWHDNFIMSRVNEMSPQSILDIGCGDARHAGLIREKKFYIGVDYSFETIKINKDETYSAKLNYDFPVNTDVTKLSYLSKDNVLLLENRADSLPVKDKAVSLILAIGLLQHLGDTDIVFKEMSRCLNYDGKIMINTLHEFSKSELLAILCLLGWKKDMRNLVFALFKKSYGEVVNGTLLARRYTKKEIAEYLSRNGLKVDKVTYNGLFGSRLMAREIILEASNA